MAFAELLDKLGRGQQLNSSEMFELRKEARALEEIRTLAKGWVKPGTSEAQFSTIRANRGIFDVSPIDGFYCSLGHAAGSVPQSIPNNTETAVVFDQSSNPSNWYSRDSEKIVLANTHRTIAVMGSLQWASNGTGRRGVHLNLYRADDTKITGITMHSLLPTGIAADTLPFSDGFWLPLVGESGNSFGTLHHLKITVVQTSGGALNLNVLRAVFFCAR